MQPQRTKVDRLALSVKDEQRPVQGFLAHLFRHIGKPAYEPRNGQHGFKSAAVVTVGGAQVAWWGWGGGSQRGRAYLDLSGLGCQLVDDWGQAQAAVADLPDVRAKRIDIAADFYRGEVRYEDVVRAHGEGRFDSRGRPPKITQIIPGNASEGRTAYVGARGNDVFFRAYEKGKKEFGDLPARVKLHGPWSVRVQEDNATEDSPSFPMADWVRLELELRSSKRELPLEVIAQRDQYFAGAYPYLSEVLPEVVPEILVRPEHIAEADLQKALALIRNQWGTTLFTALTIYQGDIGEVMGRIVGDRHNERLVKAGALLFREALCDPQ